MAKDVHTRGARLVLIGWLTAGVLLATGIGYRSAAEDSAPHGVADDKDPAQWEAHDMTRPHPPVVAPVGMGNAEESPKPPSDAVLLFDGKTLDAWQSKSGDPAPWKIEKGVAIASGTDIVTKQQFGDCQLHLEWMAPNPDAGEGQDKGNSGVKLMSQYEVQILDSYLDKNKTYADGIAGAIYGQHPPMVNASLPAGQWQTFDIAFTAPKFGADGKVEAPAHITVFHNGVLIHLNAIILGNTSGSSRQYNAHPAKQPLLLQYHGHAVKFRNIWIRPIQHS